MPLLTKDKNPELDDNNPSKKGYDRLLPNYQDENKAARAIVDNGAANFNPSDDYINQSISKMEEQFANNSEGVDNKDVPVSTPIQDSDTRGSGYANKFFGEAGGWIKKNPKKSGGLGIGIIGLGIGVYLSIIASGPLQIIHFSNMLQNFHFAPMETVSEGRIRNLMIYSKWAQGKGGLENTRIGKIEAYRLKKIDEKLANSGFTSIFDKDTGKFMGFEIDIEKLPNDITKDINDAPDKDSKRKLLANYLNVSLENIPNIEGSDGKKFNVSVEGTKQNRKLISTALRLSPEINKQTTAFIKRLMFTRANVVFNPKTRIVEGGKTKLAEYRKEKLQGKNVSIEIPPASNKEPPEGSGAEDIVNFNDINNANEVSNSAAKEIAGGNIKTPEVLSSKILSSTAGPLAAVGLLCTVKDLSSTVSNVQLMNKITPMIQASAEILSVGSKIMDGKDVDLEAIGEISNNLNSNDSSWASATTIAAEEGREVKSRTFDKYTELNPDEKSVAQNIDEIFNSLGPLGGGVDIICGAFNFVGELFNEILRVGTLGLSTKISAATTDKIFALALSTLTGAPIDLTTYQGEAYGEAVNVGGRLMANESALTMGGSILSDKTVYENKNYMAQNEDKSFSKKYLDVYNPQSVAGNLAFKASSYKSTNQVTSIPGNILSQIGSIFSKKTSASTIVSNEKYYNIPSIGFNIAKLESIENPYQNALDVQQLLKINPSLKNEFEECTGVMIDEELNFVTKSANEDVVGKYINNPELQAKCTEDANPDLYKVRVLALDTTLLKSFSCLEFKDEQSCIDIMGSSYSSGQDSASAGGSINRPTSSKAEQIQAILANPKIKWGNFGSADSQKADVQYFLTNNAVTGLLIMAEQSGVDIPLNSLLRLGETGSDHSVGKAIDIGYYGNGQPQHSADGDKLYNFLYDNYKELRISQLIWQEPPSGKKCIGNNGNSVSEVDCYEYYGKQTMDGHYHHIHIGFLPDNVEVSL